MKVPYAKPSITEREVEYATDAARHGWGSRCYEYISQFEMAFAEHLGVKCAIATSSCTGALHMGLSALGVGPGDEVVVADTNWIATAAPIVHLGAHPVFVDIRSDTWCIDPEFVKSAITPRTKAIIAVHLYGNLCEMDCLSEIGRNYGVPVIEDAAEAIGSKYRGKRAGGIGRFGAFSFHGSKTLTTGEGGMFVTDDDNLYEEVLALSHHGRRQNQTKQFWPEMVGFKYRISNLQASIGCAQMERIDILTDRKKEIFEYYLDHLKDIDGIMMNPEPPHVNIGAWMPTVVIDSERNITTEQMLKAFSEHSIDARVFFPPLSSLPMFDSVFANQNAYGIAGRAINLPSYHDMSTNDQDIVISVLRDVLGERERES